MKEHKEDIIKLSLSALLLAAACVVNHFFELKTYIQIIMFAVPYLIAGFEVLKEAAENIMKGEIFDENFLMCIASIGAFCVGEYPEAAFVMIFFGVGELFEHIATDNSRKSVKALLDIRPDTATVIKGGVKTKVKAEEVNVGDIIFVSPGERFSLDGKIIEGNTTADNSPLTGESVPVSLSLHDKVYSGCINLSGAVTVEVTNSFEQSTASKIIDLVENSGEKKAKSEKFIRKFARIYTPFVVIAAVILALIPSLLTGDVRTWVYRALMFLVVSCPCALVVSVPLTYFGGIGSAAKRGILIKGAQYISAACNIGTILFDKTGTLTKGVFEVTAVHPQIVDEQELLYLAAAAESASTHPISYSLKRAAKNSESASVLSIIELSGMGICANVDGKSILVGNERLMNANGIEYKDCHHAGTIVHVAQNGEYIGHIVISDTLKDKSKATVSALKSAGIKTCMLTGDRASAAQTIAKECGVDEFYAELSPEDKVNKTEEKLGGDKCVAFVGDGINDAPVLTRADIGISMGALGSDAAVNASDVVLMNDNISAVSDFVKISKKTEKIVKQNIAFSLFVKFAVLILCAFGFGVTDMWIASLADVGVLVIAVLNSTRALFYKNH